MKNYDVIIIGSGAGRLVAHKTTSLHLKTALVDKGPHVGGTCLNWGCMPSKTLICAADRVAEVEEAKNLGVEACIKRVDFHTIMERMRNNRQAGRIRVLKSIREMGNLDFYEGQGRFVDEHTLDVNGQKLKSKKIIVASGARPFIPTLTNLAKTDYLTNETVLELKERPVSLIIVGGGYVAVEYGHFFAAMGTRVTLLEAASRLVLCEEPEISKILEQKLRSRMAIHTFAQVEEVQTLRTGISVNTVDVRTGKKGRFVAQKMLLAAGRTSNADLLELGNTGVELEERGFIRVNEYLETSNEHIYAIGDANGQQMFAHMAAKEAALVVANALLGTKKKIDRTATPHAVFSHPQIASVGLTEEEASKNHQIKVGKAEYCTVAKGEVMLDREYLAKAVIEKRTDRILGFHIIGPSAPELIQEVVNAMASGGNTRDISKGIHIHPALSELVPATLGNALGS